MNIFNTMFSKFSNVTRTLTQFKLFGHTAQFSQFGSNSYESVTARTAIRTVAINAAKLNAAHVISKNGNIQHVKSSKYQYALSVRPNANMNAYVFWYQMFSIAEMKNNAFALINYTENGALQLYPILYSSVTALESDGMVFLRFQTNSGQQLTVSYDDIIHIRNDFVNDDMFGADNNTILSTLQLLTTIDEGMANAIKSTASLRGILKFNTMLKEDDMIKEQERFVDNFLQVSNNGGIAAIDRKADYVELKGEPKFINPVQANYINNRVYAYYGVNEKLVMNDYDADTWNAFYESKIEPYAIQASLECNYKLFTKREFEVGNRIIFEANRLQYVDVKTKINMIKELVPMGLLTINEGREIFNMSPVDDGDRRLMSLNYVDADIANEYQLKKLDGSGIINKEDGDDDDAE